MKSNDLIKALEGKWNNFGISLVDGMPVGTEQFIEILSIQDEHNLSIQCEGLQENVISAQKWSIELIGDQISMDQGTYLAKGFRENNLYKLVGIDQGKEFRHQIYVLGDKIIFLRETWEQEKACAVASRNVSLEKLWRVTQIDFSYLVKIK